MDQAQQITGEWKRSPNTQLIKEMVRHRKLTLETLGKKLHPPRTKACVSHIITGKRAPENLISEISKILDMPDTVLFPWVLQGKLTDPIRITGEAGNQA